MANVTHATVHVFNGEELGDTPHASVHILGKRGPRSGESLMVFLDLPAASAQMCGEIARALTDGYSRAPGGVTSALRLAIKLASDRVLSINKGATPNQRLEGSISCAVISDESVVIAQCGPAIAYVRTTSGAFERIDPQGVAAQQVVGVTSTIDVSFDNVAHQPGSTYLLTGDRSFPGQNDGLVNVCMSKGDPRMVAGYLNANVKQGRMTGVVFGLPVREKAGKTEAPREPIIEAPRRQPDREPVRDADRATTPLERGGRAARAAAAGAGAEFGGSMRSGLNQAGQSIKRSLASFGGKMLPDTAPLEDKAQRSKTALFALVATAVILPILIVSVVIPLYYQYSGEAERRETQLGLDALVVSARAASAPADVKENWSKVLQQVTAYDAKYPDDVARYAEAKGLARTQLDGLSKIVRVSASPIVQFASAGRRRIAASALGVYVLNLDTSLADYLALNEDRTTLSGKPAPLSFVSGVSGSLVLADVAWATNTGSRWRTEGALLFGAANVYEYSSATGRAAPLPVPAIDDKQPGQIAAGELYNNSVYMLDINAGQIWRYPITPEGLGTGSTYFRSSFDPVKQGKDIGIDGAVYVLIGNGSIQKFFNRQPQKFALTGLPEPIGNAVAMAVTGDDPNRGNVYVLDGQAGAIHQFDKTGQFVKQFRGSGDELANAQDLSYDAATNTVYVVTSDRLYSFKAQ